MRLVEYTAQFKRDLKRAKKRGKTLGKLQKVMECLEHEEPLPHTIRDHALKGDFLGCRECHIEPDWLLIYKLLIDKAVIIFTCMGTHADLFKK